MGELNAGVDDICIGARAGFCVVYVVGTTALAVRNSPQSPGRAGLGSYGLFV